MNRKLSTSDLQSILESVFFAINRPLSTQDLSRLFHTEKVPISEIKQALSVLQKKYQEDSCGIELKEVTGAWQLRTKEENKDYIRRLIKGRLFQLSPPAMEVLVIVAYKQPCKKATIDEIRGVESGHLLKTLMEKDLICFGPKSCDPGHYITYKTTKRFLEVFSLKNLKDLPSHEDIQDLLLSENTPLTTSQESLTPTLSKIKNSQQNFSEQQKNIEDELETVSKEINSVKPHTQWNKIKTHSSFPSPTGKKI
ncbi:MAG: SMC-Scp complex subunit ScpB [Bdellovibrionales bacterium]|nr:SMC-Scp complex subunit ScpB [Bdellovibrionales bacterium]